MKGRNHLVVDALNKQFRALKVRCCSKFHREVSVEVNKRHRINLDSARMYMSHLNCEVAIKHNVK